MELRQLECFFAVAEHLHFGKAAEQLLIAQPTVSDSIRRLEHELGGPLFERTTRRVTLTPLGEVFLAEAQAAYASLVRAYDTGKAVARDSGREFAVGYVGDLGRVLVDVAAKLQRRDPTFVVTIDVMPTAQQLALLGTGRLHAGIVYAPDIDDSFNAIPLGSSAIATVVPSDHPFAAQPSVSLSDLAREPLIAWPRAINPTLYHRFAAAMDGTGRPWTLVGTAVGAENVALRVLSGFGIGVVFETFAIEHQIAGVAYVRVAEPSLVVPRFLVWRKSDAHPALPLFRELLEDAMRVLNASMAVG